MESTIPFNKPYLTGRELEFISDVLESGHLSGNGPFTKRCHDFLERRYGFRKAFLTSSCTDALEMCAILAQLEPGDEVILPSYTFVSTANAFALRGAELRFADSQREHPNIDPESIEELITERTRAIVVMHYAGVACPMDEILELARPRNITVIEDAAQAIDSYYKGRPLGTLGDLAAFSFHETKNIQCGQGGLIVINNEALIERAEYVWEKGTNRSRFVRGEVDKYRWVDLGSSYLPGESVAALLWAQLLEIDSIQQKRRDVWNAYKEGLADLAPRLEPPFVPSWATVNGHLFHLVCPSRNQAQELQVHLKERGVHATTHYISLHRSPYFQSRHDGRVLSQADRFTDCLLRLPLYPELTEDSIFRVVQACHGYFLQKYQTLRSDG